MHAPTFSLLIAIFNCVTLQAAVKLSNAALVKHKNDQLLRGLKSFALLLCGKKEESVEVILVYEGTASTLTIAISKVGYSFLHARAVVLETWVQASNRPH
jgi:hypothetical protein